MSWDLDCALGFAVAFVVALEAGLAVADVVDGPIFKFCNFCKSPCWLNCKTVSDKSTGLLALEFSFFKECAMAFTLSKRKAVIEDKFRYRTSVKKPFCKVPCELGLDVADSEFPVDN